MFETFQKSPPLEEAAVARLAREAYAFDVKTEQKEKAVPETGLTGDQHKQLNRAGLKSLTDAEAIEVKKEFNNAACEPMDVLVDAMKSHRVLGLGEIHNWVRGQIHPLLLYVRENMQELRDAGATHIVLELNEKYQPIFDEFKKTGILDIKAMNNPLTGDDIAMLETARLCGLKFICADFDGHKLSDQSRDDQLAKRVSEILDKDPQAKVILWTGIAHQADASGKNSRDKQFVPAAEQLRKKYSMFTCMEERRFYQETPLSILMTDAISKPVAVKTVDTPKIRDLEFKIRDKMAVKYAAYDAILIFPTPGRKK